MAGALRRHLGGGTLRLVALLTRYGRAIEADLAETYREDLAALWAARRWRRLLVLIDGLGRTSRYVEAVAQDDEAAEERLRRAGLQALDGGRRTPPRLVEFGPTEDLLAQVADRLGDLLAATIAANSKTGKAPRIPRIDRPELAEARVRRRLREREHDTIVDLWLPSSRAGGSAQR